MGRAIHLADGNSFYKETRAAKKMKRGALLLTILVVQLANGDDLYWKPNSNWNNPSNWKLGRIPCGKDIASIPENSMIYLSEEVTIQTIILPQNGEIILGSNIAVTLSEDSQCDDDGVPAPTSMPDDLNEFIGASNHYWECRGNWLTKDNFPAEHPPCGEDNAIFEEGSYFHFVAANETISVRSLQVRGRQIQAPDELDTTEFKLNIDIVPACETNPSLCPCPSDQGCSIPDPGVTAQTGAMSPGAIVGVVLGIIALALALIAAVIAIVIVIIKYKKKGIGYKKDDFLEHEEQGQPKDSLPAPDSRNFDNPVYESTTLTPGDVQLSSYQEKPKLDFNGSDANLNPVYEVVGEVKASPTEDEFVKVDLGAMAEAVEAPPTAEDADMYEPSNKEDSEMAEESGKKKKGKQGKYERF